jgi:hypothetical protein
VTVAKRREQSKSGGASGLLKAHLKRLRQEEETWEADFQALPKPIMQSRTDYLGIVVAKPKGMVLVETRVEGRPEAADLAVLLAQALRRPLAGTAHRPRRLFLRRHPQWREVFPRLEELGIGVSVRQELPKARKAHEAYLKSEREASRATMVKPTMEQAAIEKLFPAVAKWVRGYGHIEIGDQETFGFVAQALSYGGWVFQDDKPETLAEALAALDKGLAEYFEREERGWERARKSRGDDDVLP